jgi:hypothetical protein
MGSARPCLHAAIADGPIVVRVSIQAAEPFLHYVGADWPGAKWVHIVSAGPCLHAAKAARPIVVSNWPVPIWITNRPASPHVHPSTTGWPIGVYMTVHTAGWPPQPVNAERPLRLNCNSRLAHSNSSNLIQAPNIFRAAAGKGFAMQAPPASTWAGRCPVGQVLQANVHVL